MKELDKQYLNYISPRLDRFHWERETVCNFRCPLCGDSKKSKSKARGYFIYDPQLDEYRYKCHNCGEKTGWTFSIWLREFDLNVFNEYNMEKFNLTGKTRNRLEPLRKVQPKPMQTVRLVAKEARRDESLLGNMVRLDCLPDSHFAKSYVMKRCIPDKFLSLMYYTKNYREDLKLFETNEEKQLKMPDDERLVIPFWTRDGRMKLVQGRSFDPNASLRYASTKPDDNDTKVYGEDRVVDNKLKMVVEGPIDSMFLPNCLASADANLLSVKGDIYVPDNQYRNKQVCDIIEKIIKSGVKVVLFPPNIPWKDINDMVHPEKGNMEIKKLLQLMGQNVYQGLNAEIKFATLRKS